MFGGLKSIFGSINKGIKKVGGGAVGAVNKVMPPGLKKKPQQKKIFPTSQAGV